MPLDQETRAELKAIVKEALAESGFTGNTDTFGDGSWAYGKNDLSPPREDGAVQLRFVELEMIPQYGPAVKYKEATLGGPEPVAREAVIPRWYFVPESKTTPTASVNVGSAAFRQNRAYTLKKERNWLGMESWVEGDLIPDAFASQYDYDGLRARMLHCAERIRLDKGANTLFALRDDELDIG